MFSFFKSSKKSPAVTPPDQNLDSSIKSSDDFVIVGPSNPPTNPLYPSAQLPPAPGPGPHHHSFNRQQSVVHHSYTQNVPFQLNPVLNSQSSDEIFVHQLNEITHMLNNVNPRDYDFKLERSILQQN